MIIFLGLNFSLMEVGEVGSTESWLSGSGVLDVGGVGTEGGGRVRNFGFGLGELLRNWNMALHFLDASDSDMSNTLFFFFFAGTFSLCDSFEDSDEDN